MSYPFYKGDGATEPSAVPVKLPLTKHAELRKPENYIADQGLVDAANVAILLSQPLLLTGEPGTGKTLFASSLAWELGFAEPLKFETKTDSNSQELFYTYDTLKHFQNAQAGIDLEPVDYISYHALGQAILHTKALEEIKHYLPQDFVYQTKKGFSPPDENWYRGPSMDYIKSILFDRVTRERGWFDQDFVKARLNEHFEARRNHRLLIWSLLSTEWIQRHFADGSVRPEPEPALIVARDRS